MKRYAVIDLGTNTFHLLIAERGDDEHIREVYRERRFVVLAEEGIEAIGPAPFQRGIDTLRHYKTVLEQYEVPSAQARAFGTAALRTASNGPLFIQQVLDITGIQVRLISGGREAELIHKGVIQAVPPSAKRMLIMDIGGGSVEFIIAGQDGIFWAQSYPIGVALLYKRFHRHEPIRPEESDALRTYLREVLQPLKEALREYPAKTLVGASGTFDVLEQFLSEERAHPLHTILPVSRFDPFHQQLLGMTRDERRALEGIPPERADMIIVALILIEVVLPMAGIQQIITSAYAMKEGMLAEMMNGEG